MPLTVATLAGIAPKNMSDATGIATLVRYLGGNIGIALLQVLQVRRAAQAQDAMAATTTISSTSIANLVHAGGLHAAAARLAGMIASNVSLISYLYLFRVSALIFAVCLPLLLLLPKRSRA